MKIACISASMVPGNTANAIQTMKATQALVQTGHEVELWLPDFGQNFDWNVASQDYGLDQPFPIRRLSVLMPLNRYDFCMRAVFQARRWSADIIYAWPLQAAALASQLGSSTVLEVHDKPRGRLGPWLFKRFLTGRGARALLVTTRELERHLGQQFGQTHVGKLARYGPNGVDLDRYRGLPSAQEARRRLSLPEGFTAVYSGHLYPGRGAELMFELASRMPQVNFIWAGGTEQAISHWRAKKNERKLENLILLGFVPNQSLPMIQAAGDVLLMPYGHRIEVSGGGDSSQFANPMKVFEYLAAGRAILSSDIPVLREVLNERVALMLPAEEVDAWQYNLAELQKNPSVRATLGKAAREEAQQYGWQARARRALAGLEETSHG